MKPCINSTYNFTEFKTKIFKVLNMLHHMLHHQTRDFRLAFHHSSWWPLFSKFSWAFHMESLILWVPHSGLLSSLTYSLISWSSSHIRLSNQLWFSLWKRCIIKLLMTLCSFLHYLCLVQWNDGIFFWTNWHLVLIGLTLIYSTPFRHFAPYHNFSVLSHHYTSINAPK